MESNILAPVNVCVELRSANIIVPDGKVATVFPDVVSVREWPPERIREAEAGMVSVPAELEIVRPLKEEAVIAPIVALPNVAAVANRLVELAVVANKLVEVALVVVERVMLLKIFAPLKVLLSE
jgi:hypothetical protein